LCTGLKQSEAELEHLHAEVADLKQVLCATITSTQQLSDEAVNEELGDHDLDDLQRAHSLQQQQPQPQQASQTQPQTVPSQPASMDSRREIEQRPTQKKRTTVAQQIAQGRF